MKKARKKIENIHKLINCYYLIVEICNDMNKPCYLKLFWHIQTFYNFSYELYQINLKYRNNFNFCNNFVVRGVHKQILNQHIFSRINLNIHEIMKLIIKVKCINQCKYYQLYMYLLLLFITMELIITGQHNTFRRILHKIRVIPQMHNIFNFKLWTPQIISIFLRLLKF